MRILVTGARGKVGAAAVAVLADAGHEVRRVVCPAFCAWNDVVSGDEVRGSAAHPRQVTLALARGFNCADLC